MIPFCAKSRFDIAITHIYVYIYMYIYMYIYEAQQEYVECNGQNLFCQAGYTLNEI